MKTFFLMAILAIVAPNMSAAESSNRQMIADYNVSRATMLTALTAPHRQLLASIAARLTTSTSPDYVVAARQLDSALSPAERHAILAAANTEHEKMRVIMRNVGNSMHGSTVLHIGSPPLRGSDTAGFILIHTAMNLGPMTMTTMIVSR